MSPVVMDLNRTPGVFYALSYWLSTAMFLTVFYRRFPRGKEALFSFLYLAALEVFMAVTDGVDELAFILTMLAVYASIFLFFWRMTKMDWRKALYLSVRIFLLGEMAASFEWQMFYYGVVRLHMPMTLGVNLLFLLLHIPVFTASFFIERQCRNNLEDVTITWRELTAVLCIGLFIYVLSNLSYATPNSPFSTRLVPDIYAIRTLADVGGVFLLYAFHAQLCEAQGRLEKEYLHKLLHMQKENYRLSGESVELINRKYHDLKHQIQLLRAEITSGEKLRYLDEMEQEIRSYEAQNKTGNKALDTMLTAKSFKCQSLGISLTCVADGKELAFMKPTDVSVLFGNALDNAIESVEKLDNPEKRLIHLSVARQKSFLRIRMENCCEGELRFVDGLPSTRKDARYHGYGMKSIRSIVEKYGGSMTVKVENGWFELRVLIPVPEIKQS